MQRRSRRVRRRRTSRTRRVRVPIRRPPLPPLPPPRPPLPPCPPPPPPGRPPRTPAHPPLRRYVAALDERLRGLTRSQVHRRQRLHERRQRLHRRPYDDLLAVRHAAFDPARAVRLAAQPGVAANDLVV